MWLVLVARRRTGERTGDTPNHTNKPPTAPAPDAAEAEAAAEKKVAVVKRQKAAAEAKKHTKKAAVGRKLAADAKAKSPAKKANPPSGARLGGQSAALWRKDRKGVTVRRGEVGWRSVEEIDVVKET